MFNSQLITFVCVGTSLLSPAKPFMDLWYQVSTEFSDYKLHLVPFEDNHEGINVWKFLTYMVKLS